PPRGLRLRLVLAVPGADRPGRGRPRGASGGEAVTGVARATLRSPWRSKLAAMKSAAFLLGCGMAAACTASASEVEPPADQLFFPTGAAVAPDDSVLFVANANSELRYDSGSIAVLDLALVDQTIADWTTNQLQADGCTQDADHRETLVCDEAPFIISG